MCRWMRETLHRIGTTPEIARRIVQTAVSIIGPVLRLYDQTLRPILRHQERLTPRRYSSPSFDRIPESTRLPRVVSSLPSTPSPRDSLPHLYSDSTPPPIAVVYNGRRLRALDSLSPNHDYSRRSLLAFDRDQTNESRRCTAERKYLFVAMENCRDVEATSRGDGIAPSRLRR